MAKVVEGRPAKMGFRMPAEWEPHEQCWMGWPVLSFPLHFFFAPSSMHATSPHFRVGATTYKDGCCSVLIRQVHP
jgi:hypothetical protein